MNLSRCLICAALSGRSCQEICEQADQAGGFVDVLEIRLDTMLSPDAAAFHQLSDKPLLFTNRARWEGGCFAGTEQERVALLQQAVRTGCTYIDIELKTDETLRSSLLVAAKEALSQVIVSFHNFSETPSEKTLRTIVRQMHATGADAGKIVTTAAEPNEVLRVLALLEYASEMRFPLSAFCMGPAGRISRLATMYLGGFMTYVAPVDLQGTAPGQFAADHFHSLIQLFENDAH
ncbi:MAG: type I 3-dehydroquinate dehydratase [Desulfobulbus propionicus]|nr:MAG: type I 3-dehydroquinate dehydratase [Desulfobulbus propionicus]